MKVLNIRITNGYSGTEKYIIYLFSYFKEHSILKSVTFSNNKEFLKELKACNLDSKMLRNPLFEIGTKKELLKLVKNFRSFKKAYSYILKFANKFRPDIIILHSMTEKLILTPILKNKGFIVVWEEHESIFSSERSIIIKLWYKFMSSKADKIIAVSKNTKNDLKVGGVDITKIVACYIGIDSDKFKRVGIKRQKMRNLLKIAKSQLCIGYVGNVNTEKGIDRFVSVAKTLLKKDHSYFFIVIGDGPRLKNVKNIVKDLKSNFYFTGQVNNVNDYLQAVDILFLPTEHHEGVSLAMIESAFMQIPIITKNIGGNRELVTSDVGVMYDKFSIKNSIDIINNLTKNDKYKKIGISARQSVSQRFSSQYAARSFLNVLENVTKIKYSGINI